MYFQCLLVDFILFTLNGLVLASIAYSL